MNSRPEPSSEPGKGSLRKLSSFQTLVWTGQQLEPDSPMYNMAFKLTLSGPVDVERFEQAVRHVFQDTETHRLQVELKSGLPYFRVAEQVDFAMERLDFSKQDSAALDQWCQDRCRQNFS